MQTVRRDAHKQQSVKAKAMLLNKRIAFAFFASRKHFKSITSTLFRKAVTALAITALVVPGSVLVFGLNGRAIAAESEYLNFQARILQSSGAVVPDGTYHIEFKLYYVPSEGTALWTETRSPSTADPNKAIVKNGYVSVRLGAVTSFPSTINWDQQLYIGMNIGGTGGSAVWDGEMSPRLIVTSVPYAKEAKTAAGVTTNNTSSTSTNSDGVTISTGNAAGATSNSGNISVDTGTATGTTGSISIGGTNASALTLGRTGLTVSVAGGLSVAQTLTVTGASTFNGNLNVANSSNLQIGGTTVISSSRVLQNVTADTSILTSGTLGVARGGTGASTFTVNGVLYGNGTNAVQATAAGTEGQVLLSNASGVPTFTSLSGDVTVSGTGVMSISADSVALGTDTTGNYVGSVSAGTGLAVTGVAAENWTATVALDYTATLAGNPTLAAGQSSFASTGIIFEGSTADTNELLLTVVDPTADRTITLPNASGTFAVSASGNIALSAAGDITLTGQVPVANGGTGASTAQGAINALSGLTTNGDILYYDGSNATRLARGTDGQCLLSNATSIAWGSCGAGGSNLFTDGGSFSYLTDTAEDFVLGGSTVASAKLFFDVSASTLYLGSNNTGSGGSNGSITLYSSGNGVADPTISADASGNLNIASGDGSVVLGDGTGGIELQLTRAADLFTASKTFTASTGYSSADYSFTRTITGGANALTGSVLKVEDASTFTSGSSAPNVLLVNQNNTSATGNLILAQTGGSTTRFQVTTAGNTTVGGTLAVTGQTDFTASVAYKRGTDFSTTGTQNNVNFGDVSLVRLTGATAQTITGVQNGRDGRVLTIMNAAANSATISNNSVSSDASNRIITGNGTDLTLASGASISLIYDSAVSLWRIMGGSGGGLNTIGAFVSTTSYSNGAQLSVGNTTLTFGAADASNPGMVSTSTQTFGGAKTFNSLITGSAGLTVTGAAISLNASSNFATNINTGTSTGAVNIGNNTGNTALTLDSGTGAINIGTGAQVRTVNIGTGGSNAAVQTVNIGSTNTTSTTTINAGTSGSINAAGQTNFNNSVAFKKGTDITTAGTTTNDLSITDASTIKFIGTAGQTINGIAGGRDGRILTIINATSGPGGAITFTQSSGTAGNQVTSGLTGNLTLEIGASMTLVYDSTGTAATSFWRVTGGGVSTTLQEAYNYSTATEITLDTTRGGLTLRNATGDTITGNLFELQNNAGTLTYFGITPTGLLMKDSDNQNTLEVISTASTHELRVYDPDGGNYARIYATSTGAVFTSNTGTTQVGSGSASGGDINLLLTTATDNLNASKTFSAAAAYGDSDFNFTRTITGTSFALTGSVMKVEDLSSFTTGSSAPNVLLVNQNNTSATGNLLLLQTGGVTERFKVTTAGDTTITGNLVVGGGSIEPREAIRIDKTFTSSCSFGCYGIASIPTIDNVTNGPLTAIYARANVANTSFTVGNTYGLVVAGTVKGASATVTNNYGILVNSQTVGTNDYGVYIESADTYSLYVAGGASYFGGSANATTLTADTSLTVGSSAGVGLLTNNGATRNTTLSVSNLSTGGSIGSAASTVDIYTSISINQTTAGQTITIPSPTQTTQYGRLIYVSNVGSASFTLLGNSLNAGTTATLVWSNTNGGASWQVAGTGTFNTAGILAQNASDQTADFRITGTGRANTSFQSPLYDTATAVALNIGTTNATAINLNKATTLSGLLTVSSAGINSASGIIQLGTSVTNITGPATGDITIETGATSSNDLTLSAPDKVILDSGTSYFEIDNGILTTNGTSLNALGALTIASGTSTTLTLNSLSGTLQLGANTTNITATGALTIASGGTNTSLTLEGTGTGQIIIGSTSTGNILLGGGSASTGCTLTNSTGALACTAGLTATGLSSSGALGIDAGASSAINIGATNATSIIMGGNASVLITQRVANSNTNALLIEEQGGTDLLAIDTTNDRITLGVSDTVGTLLILDTKTSSGDPTGVNGGMYYNSNSLTFRCFENGIWRNCIASPSNASVANQVITNSVTDTYLTNSNMTIPISGLRAGTQFRWRIIMSKTAAGTATSTFNVRMGANGTTADALLCTAYTTTTQTAAADTAVVEITATIRSINSTTGSAQCAYDLSHTGANTGFDNALANRITVPAALTNLNTALTAGTVGLSFVGGTANVITFSQIQANSVGL